MIFGVSAMILVGLTWLVCGIIMGRAPKEGVNVGILIMLSALLAVAVSLPIGLWQGLPDCSTRVLLLVFLSLFCCGLINNIQLLLLARAMQCGPNGMIWSITQAGFIVPFMVGSLFFQSQVTFWQLSGFFSILAALVLMSIGKREVSEFGGLAGNWKVLSFLAFVVTGLSQALSNLPSYFPEAEAVSSVWRSAFFAAGMAATTLLLAAITASRRREFRQELWRGLRHRRLLCYCGLLELFEIVGSYFLLYPGMDRLAQIGAGAIAYPLMVASCIVGFEFYSLLILREKRNLLQLVGLGLCLLGVGALAVT